MFPVYGQTLSDATGLVNRLDIQTGGHDFEIEVISNLDVEDFDFDADEKRLTLYIVGGLENNLGEIIIPQSLLSGDFTFYLNDVEFSPKFNSNEKITFVTLSFMGSGNNKLDIFGTVYLDGLTEKNETQQIDLSNTEDNARGGCLIATATYGSELAPQVQYLRELRDNSLHQTQSGYFFMNSFNEFYYSFSPIIADYERENSVFRETVKTVITTMILSIEFIDRDFRTISWPRPAWSLSFIRCSQSLVDKNAADLILPRQ